MTNISRRSVVKGAAWTAPAVAVAAQAPALAASPCDLTQFGGDADGKIDQYTHVYTNVEYVGADGAIGTVSGSSQMTV